jgi:hypothetical protein
MFSKENFSNGCISTVDVLYPAAAADAGVLSDDVEGVDGAAFGLRIVAAMESGIRAPHDLGTYPQATGQVYGGTTDAADAGRRMRQHADPRRGAGEG